MAYDLGTVKGSVSIDIAQAVAAYAALRRTNAATNTALLESDRALRKVGVGLVGIGAVALAGFGIAVKAAADFQNKMRFFQVVTKSSAADMDLATKKAFELARASGYTASQVADSFVELGKAGINAKQIIEGVGQAVAQLGAAAQIPLTDASEIIVNTMKTFQLGATQATHIADALAGSANASTVDITDLAYALRYVGGTAASLKVPFEDVLNALGQLGNAGIRGSTGGTALRKILLQLAPASAKATAELEKLGIITSNGGVAEDKMASAVKSHQTAVEDLHKAELSLQQLQQRQGARSSDQATSSAASAASHQAAAQNALASAQRRLADAEANLQAVQAKLASTPLGATAAQQASSFASLETAQRRLADAQANLQATQQRYANSPVGSGASLLSQVTASQELQNAQRRVAEAQKKVTETGQPLGKGVEKLNNLFFNANGTAKSLSEIFQILQDHMRGMSQQQKVAALNIVFGNRAISSALILTRQGAKGFAAFGKEMGQTTSAEVMAKRLDTLQGAWHKFTAAISVALVKAGTPAQTPLKLLVQLLTHMVNAFANLPGPVQAVLSTLILLFGVLTGGIGTFILFVSFIGRATRAWREFRAAMLFVKEIQLVQRAMALLNITMLANPVVLIIVAIVALIALFVLLIVKVKPVREFFIRLGKDMVGAFGAVIRFFGRLPKFFEGVWNAVKGAFSAAIDWIKKNWDILLAIFVPGGVIVLLWRRFGDKIVSVVKGIFKAVVGFLTRLPGEIAHGVAAGFMAVAKFLETLPNRVLYLIGFIMGRMIRWEIEMVALAIRLGARFLRAIISFFEKLPGQVLGFLERVNHDVGRVGLTIVTTAARWARNAFRAVVDFFEKLPGRIAGALHSAWNATVRWFTSIYHTAVNLAQRLFQDVLHWVEQLPGNISDLFHRILSDLARAATNIYNAAITFGENLFNGAISFIKDLPSAIYNAFLNAIKSIGGLAQKAFDTAKGWAGSLWNGFKKGLFGSPRTKIEYALEDMTDTADRETKKLAAQVRYLNQLATRIPNGALLSHSTGAHRPAFDRSGGVGNTSVTKHYDIDLHYPQPEMASDAIPRVLDNLEFVGALG